MEKSYYDSYEEQMEESHYYSHEEKVKDEEKVEDVHLIEELESEASEVETGRHQLELIDQSRDYSFSNGVLQSNPIIIDFAETISITNNLDLL